MSALSVIICTSPGRQAHLAVCLEALARQTVPPGEVLVVDDGSEGMAEVLAPFQSRFRFLDYDWRSGDHNLSRSRNRGAARARGDFLIFMNSDVVLNPRGLGYYAYYLRTFPSAILWGYVGCRKRYPAPSVWFPQVQVNWLDFRFFPLSATELYCHPDLEQAPHTLAGGHHFALSRAVYEELGGHDETFLAWGEEDVEFALRGILAGHPMVFLGDPWAEHVVHGLEEPFHTAARAEMGLKIARICELEQELLQSQSKARVIFGFEYPNFLYYLQNHYLRHYPQALEQELRKIPLN